MKKKPRARARGKQNELGRCVNPDAAGIDLGSRQHYVALPQRLEQPVRNFGCYTQELEDMAQWLKSHGITTVAMEATGVYWIPVYQVLERHQLEVHLVNTKHLKMVPGRKTDVQDCQWIQLLHEAGLLRGSFRPPQQVCTMRTLLRHRDNLTEETSRHVLRMHKALEQMNIQLHKTVSNIVGETGLAIITNIVAGERDPFKLARHRNFRCRRSPEDFAKALMGDWREEHLFCLKQELESYNHLVGQIAACDEAIERHMQELPTKANADEAPAATKRKAEVPLRIELFRITGHDLTVIEGLAPPTLAKLVAEIGTDVTAWPTVKHFTSWAQCCPPNHITGGKRKKGKTHGTARVAQIFRVSAASLANSNTALGAFYRRIRSRRGSSVAIGATAHKLAQRFYYLLKHGTAYVQQAANQYEVQYRERLAKNAMKTLKRLGMTVMVTEEQALSEAVR